MINIKFMPAKVQFVVYFLFAFFATSCAKLPSYEGAIRKATEVKLFEVEDVATAPNMQDPNREYSGNYHIVRQVLIGEIHQQNIKNIVLMPELIIRDQVKSCVHQGQYALEFLQRNSSKVTMVVSVSPCSKAYITSIDGSEELVDLAVSNILESILVSLCEVPVSD